MNAFQGLHENYPTLNEQLRDEVQFDFLPPNIRIAIARGELLELTISENGQHEYSGYCINLASRLQSYCKELHFIASARVAPTRRILAEYKYAKVIATKLRGLDREPVLVDLGDFQALSDAAKSRLFEKRATARHLNWRPIPAICPLSPATAL